MCEERYNEPNHAIHLNDPCPVPVRVLWQQPKHNVPYLALPAQPILMRKDSNKGKDFSVSYA
jgi:hypothetical protein